jgi:hypothetical protein
MGKLEPPELTRRSVSLLIDIYSESGRYPNGHTLPVLFVYIVHGLPYGVAKATWALIWDLESYSTYICGYWYDSNAHLPCHGSPPGVLLQPPRPPVSTSNSMCHDTHKMGT